MIDQNDIQIGGDHYKVPGQTEHWDFVWQHDLDYFQGQITKYVTRWKKKGGLKDLQKARHFLDKYIELISRREMNQAAEKQAYEVHPKDKDVAVGQTTGAGANLGYPFPPPRPTYDPRR